MDGFDDPEYEARCRAHEEQPRRNIQAKEPEAKEPEAKDATAQPKPDLAIAKAFVEIFTGGAPIRIAMFNPTIRSGFDIFEAPIEQNWERICDAQAQGYGAFFYLNTIRPGPGQGKGGCATNKDVTAISTLSVDFDGGLPVAYHFPPDLVIRTSIKANVQRGQALWFVEPIERGDMDLPAFSAIFRDAQRRLAVHYDPAGWADPKGPQITDKNVVDLRRIHRLPGSLHLKNAAAPQLVTMKSADDV
jgi:hypothetical protein